jgi:hypothetical protein
VVRRMNKSKDDSKPTNVDICTDSIMTRASRQALSLGLMSNSWCLH